MSEKDWYRVLLEDNCTMKAEDGRQREYIMCRVERASLTTDCEQCWRLARLPGLGSENFSFLFKLIHQILPTQERVARAKPNTNPYCKAQGITDVVEDLSHALITCQANDNVGTMLIELLRVFLPRLEVESLLRLDLHLEHDLELPIVLFLTTVLNSIWKLRQPGNKVQKYLVRSELDALNNKI